MSYDLGLDLRLRQLSSKALAGEASATTANVASARIRNTNGSRTGFSWNKTALTVHGDPCALDNP